MNFPPLGPMDFATIHPASTRSVSIDLRMDVRLIAPVSAMAHQGYECCWQGVRLIGTAKE
jgi:hypothetical protein